MAETLNILPSSIIAGESIVKTITGIVAGESSLSYQFAADTPVSVDCAVVNDAFILTVSAAQTLTFRNGRISFVGMLTDNAGVVSCVDSGVIIVAPSPMATSDYSTALTAVEAAIAEYGSNPNAKVKVGDIDIEYKSLDDLLTLRNFYRNEVKKDKGQAPAGGPLFINTRFK